MGRLRVLAWQGLSVAAIVLAWEVAVRWRLVDPLFVPAPSSIVRVLGVTGAEALPRLGDTLVKTLLGYALAILAGVPTGLVLGSRPTAHAIAMPYVVALYGVPKILVLPWIALVFGIGLSTAVLSAAVFAIFPVVVLVAAGTRDVDPALVTVAASMGASRGQIIRKVLLPAVLPSVLTAMRVALVFALLGTLIAEMLAGTRGMGFQMQRAALAFRAPELFAATAIVSVVSISVVLFLEHLNTRLGRWR
ncbi:MAG TPA: ABC transporter permease subunit [Methylomirabilota bacterium]|jgi:NitT/TauT family transport system permease protein|nr:ABC transporter permease subunit [Methylomirabilota bacterium]